MDPMEIVIVLIALGGGAVASYFSDLRDALRLLRNDGGIEAMERAERELAFAEIVALALFADGEVTMEERATLRRVGLTAAEKGDLLDVDEALERIAIVARAALTEDTLRGRIEGLAEKLDAPQRGQAFAMACALARGGSRLRGPSGYRDNAQGSGEALIDVFAKALAIDEGDRADLAQRYEGSGV